MRPDSLTCPNESWSVNDISFLSFFSRSFFLSVLLLYRPKRIYACGRVSQPSSLFYLFIYLFIYPTHSPPPGPNDHTGLLRTIGTYYRFAKCFSFLNTKDKVTRNFNSLQTFFIRVYLFDLFTSYFISFVLKRIFAGSLSPFETGCDTISQSQDNFAIFPGCGIRRHFFFGIILSAYMMDENKIEMQRAKREGPRENLGQARAPRRRIKINGLCRSL